MPDKEYLKKRLGALPSPWDERDLPFAAVPVVKKEEIPGEYSLRERQTSVKHQGGVGACTAFSTCAIDEVLHKVNDLNLSERHLYCRRSNKPNPGMYPRDACKLLQKEGVCLEVCWQYIPDAEKLCKGAPCLSEKEQSKQYRINSYHRVFNSLKTALYQFKTPILLVCPVYENWGGIGSGGIVPMPNNSEFIGYHAMVLVGWSKKYLEVKNSWGENFGDKGYLYIPQNYPITEGWVLEKCETNEEEKVKVDWKIGKKNLFGANVTCTINSTIKCRASLFVNDTRKGFTKHIQEGTTHIHFNIPFELNTETDIKLAFVEVGSFFNQEIVGVWEGVLSVNCSIKNK